MLKFPFSILFLVIAGQLGKSIGAGGRLGIEGGTRFAIPRGNIWVTIASKTNQLSLCLGLGRVTEPFKTCLIGVPVQQLREFREWIRNQSCLKFTEVNVTITTFGLTDAQRKGV